MACVAGDGLGALVYPSALLIFTKLFQINNLSKNSAWSSEKSPAHPIH